MTNHQCDYCSAPIKKENPQSFCSMCGAKLNETYAIAPKSKNKIKEIALTAEATEEITAVDSDIDDSEVEEQKVPFLERVKYFHFNSLYQLSFYYSKKTEDLIRSRLLLLSNLRLIHKHPIIHSEDRVDLLTNELKSVSSQIRNATQDIYSDLQKLEQMYQSKQFYEARDNLKITYKNIIQNGLVYLLNPSFILKLKLNRNISLKQSLRKYGKKVPEEILEPDLIRKFFTLDGQVNELKRKQALTNKIFLYHPDTLESVIELRSIYEEGIKIRKISLPEVNFGKKLSFWFGNTKEGINILVQNYKFSRLTSAAKKWKNLPLAWTKLQEAEKLLEAYPAYIYLDAIEKSDVLKLQVKSLIDELNFETKKQIAYAQELMVEFRFVESEALLQLSGEKLGNYSMAVLIEQEQEILHICEVNKELHSEILEIEVLFQSEDYLGSQKAMQILIKKIETKVDPEFLLSNIKEKVDQFSDQINTCRDEGEEKLTTELVEIKTELMEKLNFKEVNTLLQQKHSIATQQEYHSYLDQHKHFLKEFTQNYDILQHIANLEELFNQEKFGEVQKGIKEIEQEIDKPKFLCYSNLQQKFQVFSQTLEKKIAEEDTNLQLKIDQISELINSSIDIEQSTKILQEIVGRQNLTVLDQFNPHIEKITLKIKLNQEGLEKVLEVQHIFSDGDIKVANRECEKLLEKIDSALKETSDIYSSTLHEQISNLHEQIEIGLQDGVEKLNADFYKINSQVKTTLDYTEIVDLLTNYEIRAQRLGMESVKQEMHVLNLQCQHNLAIISKCNLFESNYDSMTEFPHTLHSIKELVKDSGDDRQIFAHIHKVIQTLEKKVTQGNSEREERMNDSLKMIKENEINKLNFDAAHQSLETLLDTATGLVVKSIIPEIKKYLELTVNHQKLLVSVEEAIAVAENGKVIEARNMTNGLQTAISQYAGIIINPMRDYVTGTSENIQNQIDADIASVKEAIKKIVGIIEDKQAESVYSELLEWKDKALYLEINDVVNEIDDLVKLCHLQFDPTEKDKKRKKRKAKQQKVAETTTIFKEEEEILDETSFVSSAAPTTITFMIPAMAEEEIIPKFSSMKEKREFKRKVILRKRARIHKPPKTTENLNNQVRSSQARRQLQLYSQQINRPVKRSNIDNCESCGAKQPTNEEKFCFFCGKMI